MFEHFTDHARRVLDLEGMEAQRMHHDYLGTEHLLLALIREKEGHGHRAFENLGICLKAVRQAVSQLVEEGPETSAEDGFHQTPRMQHVLQMAYEEARKVKSPNIGTEHLLLALLREPEGVAMLALASMGVDPQKVHDEITRMLAEEQTAMA